MITEDDLKDLVNRVQKMPNRTDLLNHLAEKYNLQRYLEIGVQVPELNFDKIICKEKFGVDPDPKAKATFPWDSDTFFHNFGNDYTDWPDDFDLIFIDGLHTAEQVKKDFENALKILSPNGFIVLHDCNPEKEEHTIVPRPTARGHWNGDVWRFAAAMHGYEHLERQTVDIDNGCMVFRNNDDWTSCNWGISEMPWSHFDKNRKELLNLITWDEFIAAHSLV